MSFTGHINSVTVNASEYYQDGVLLRIGHKGDVGPKGDKGDKGDKGHQGVQGFAEVFAFKLFHIDGTGHIVDACGNIINTPPGPDRPPSVPYNSTGGQILSSGWYFNQVHETPTASQVVFISTAIYDPQNPTKNLQWSNPYEATGNTGPQGAPGPQGVQGPKGDMGATGPTGETGAKGSVGPQGQKGVQGPEGEKGTAGTNGTDGTNGAKGEKGDPGMERLMITTDSNYQFKGRCKVKCTLVGGGGGGGSGGRYVSGPFPSGGGGGGASGQSLISNLFFDNGTKITIKIGKGGIPGGIGDASYLLDENNLVFLQAYGGQNGFDGGETNNTDNPDDKGKAGTGGKGGGSKLNVMAPTASAYYPSIPGGDGGHGIGQYALLETMVPIIGSVPTYIPLFAYSNGRVEIGPNNSGQAQYITSNWPVTGSEPWGTTFPVHGSISPWPTTHEYLNYNYPNRGYSGLSAYSDIASTTNNLITFIGAAPGGKGDFNVSPKFHNPPWNLYQKGESNSRRYAGGGGGGGSTGVFYPYVSGGKGADASLGHDNAGNNGADANYYGGGGGGGSGSWDQTNSPSQTSGGSGYDGVCILEITYINI